MKCLFFQLIANHLIKCISPTGGWAYWESHSNNNTLAVPPRAWIFKSMTREPWMFQKVSPLWMLEWAEERGLMEENMKSVFADYIWTDQTEFTTLLFAFFVPKSQGFYTVQKAESMLIEGICFQLHPHLLLLNPELWGKMFTYHIIKHILATGPAPNIFNRGSVPKKYILDYLNIL